MRVLQVGWNTGNYGSGSRRNQRAGRGERWIALTNSEKVGVAK